MEVLPFPVGSQARPTLGARFILLDSQGGPKVLCASEMFRRLALLPLTSFGEVTNSWRNPRFKVKFGRTRKSSWTNQPNSVCRHPCIGLLGPPTIANSSWLGRPAKKLGRSENVYVPRRAVSVSVSP